MDVELYIEGVPEHSATDAIRKRVRNLMATVDQPGDWRITMSPSETRGEWDVGMTESSRRWFGSFTGTVDRLPELLELELRAFLERPAGGPDVP